MLTKNETNLARKRAAVALDKCKIALTATEKENIEVTDFGLSDLERIGLEIVVYVNTDRCCAKELVLFPWQICPEHRHPNVEDQPGKEETFRCRAGEVYLYVPGEPASNPMARVPEEKKQTFTVWNEIVLKPGEQYTLMPDTLHWFQAGPDGTVVSEFSTKSRDETDIFTDQTIARVAERESR